MILFIRTSDIDQFYTVVNISYTSQKISITLYDFLNCKQEYVIKEYYNLVQLTNMCIHFGNKKNVEKWHYLRNFRYMKAIIICELRDKIYIQKYINKNCRLS